MGRPSREGVSSHHCSPKDHRITWFLKGCFIIACQHVFTQNHLRNLGHHTNHANPSGLRRRYRLAVEGSQCGIHFGRSKYEVLTQDWQGASSVFILGSVTMAVDESLAYLGFITAAGRTVDEITTRIAKAKFAFANLRHFRCVGRSSSPHVQEEVK